MHHQIDPLHLLLEGPSGIGIASDRFDDPNVLARLRDVKVFRLL
jgi:hypothetical protein